MGLTNLALFRGKTKDATEALKSAAASTMANGKHENGNEKKTPPINAIGGKVRRSI
jgi:hypothetical protein